MCKKYGDIKSTKSIIDKQTNKCKGYGFVDFRKEEDAIKALNDLKTKEKKDVQLAKQREQDPTNLYFANLPLDIDEKQLNEMLKQKYSANINSTRIMRERNGQSKGVGFARIDDNKLCDKIIQELNGKSFPDHANKSKLLLVKLADFGQTILLNPNDNNFSSVSNQDSTGSHNNPDTSSGSTSSFYNQNNNMNYPTNNYVKFFINSNVFSLINYLTINAFIIRNIRTNPIILTK
jgi:RNA recognition motif-containing protein